MEANDTIKPLNFKGLLSAFADSLQEAAANQDVQILKNAYHNFSANTDHDKKSPLDQAFRDMLLFQIYDDVEKIGSLIRLSVEAVRAEIVSVTIPVVLLGDIFETVTLDKCEKIFYFVEDMVMIWKEEIFFTSCKNNILRMCNDLLRRLSRTQNTVFCGRILLFLSKFFPFSERSGLNIVSEFNLENVTEYGVDGKDMDDSLDDESIKNMPIKIDYNLYCKFWSLQDFFRNPNQCYSKAQWKMFQAHAKAVLEAFSSFKLEDTNVNLSKKPRLSKANSCSPEKMQMDVEHDAPTEGDGTEPSFKTFSDKDNFFAKFLTNPKLLALQLSDSKFRRSVLTQFLILFQYLQLPVKFKSESNTLTTAQSDFIKETEPFMYSLLEQTPPNGKQFANTVRHMLSREIMWNSWKNDGCKEFKRPTETKAEPISTFESEQSKSLGDKLKEAQRYNQFYLGSNFLTELWNFSPDNLQACKSETRNFLPNVETFLENTKEKNDPSYEWRALRLLARQSPHFFSFLNSSSYKISDYLDCVRRKIAKEKLEMLKVSSSSGSNQSLNSLSNEKQDTNDIKTEDPDIKVEKTSEHDPAEMLPDPADANSQMEVEEEAILHTANESDVEDEQIESDESLSRPKPVTASKEQIEEIAPLIGSDWKKLGKKLGYTPDELLFFEQDNTGSNDGACILMLTNWFADDDDATLDNWAYMLEGLEINEAATAVKALIERLSKSEPETKTAELLSD